MEYRTLKLIALLGILPVFCSAQVTFLNISVENVNPVIRAIYATNPVYLNDASTTKVLCDAVIVDRNGYGDIKNITATLWHSNNSAENLPNNAQNHYSNFSVLMSYSKTDNVSANASLSFYVQPTADTGAWTCKMTVNDKNGTSDSNITSLMFYSKSCSNGVKNPGEELVDCGGTCPPCLNVTNIALECTPGQEMNTTVKLMSLAAETINVTNIKKSGLVSGDSELTVDEIYVNPATFLLLAYQTRIINVSIMVPEYTSVGNYVGVLLVETGTILNATIHVSVNVTESNVPPKVDYVRVPYPVILSSESGADVWCNTTISDENGYGDISKINAVLWHTASASETSQPSKENYYLPAQSNMGQTSNTSGNFSSLFSLEPEAKLGNWTCRITATDKSGSAGYSSTTFEVYDESCSNEFLDSGEELVDCGGTCPPCLRGDNIYVESDAGISRSTKTTFQSLSLETLLVERLTATDLLYQQNKITADNVFSSTPTFVIEPNGLKDVDVTVNVPAGVSKGVYHGRIDVDTNTTVKTSIDVEVNVRRRGRNYMDVKVYDSCVGKTVRIYVREEEFYSPLENVTVIVHYDGNVLTITSTDKTGIAKFVPGGEGVYAIRAQKDGYQDESESADIVLCGLEPSCDDGIPNQDETGIDCGGSCPPCSCMDGIQNQDEEDVDCGGSCLPCHCFDGIYSGDETGIDCGGSCLPCPMIKRTPMLIMDVPSYATTGKDIGVRTKDDEGNEVQTVIKITKPDGAIQRFRTDRNGSLTTFIDIPGTWEFSAYKPGYIPVTINLTVIAEEVVEAAGTSLLLVLFIALIYMRSRRRHVIADKDALIRLLDTGEINRYKAVYTTSRVFEQIRELSEGVVKSKALSMEEEERAEKMALDYGTNIEIAELLLLSKKIRAKKLITETELPDEVVRKYRALKIVSSEQEI